MATSTPPAEWPLTIWAGSTWVFDFVYKFGAAPVDLSGYSARMQVRATRGNGVTKQLPYGTVIAELSTSDGSIALNADAVTGRIRLKMSAAKTTTLAITPARYDLELVDGATGDVMRILMGEVTISEEMTKSG